MGVYNLQVTAMQLLTVILWFALGALQQTASGSVQGTVLRTGTTDPIERVQVTLATGTQVPISVLTDKEGHFSFFGVVPGRYTISIHRDGYLFPGSTQFFAGFQSASDDLAYVNGFAGAAEAGGPTAPGPAVSVGSSERVAGLTYYLTPGGTISGRILDPLGRPAVNADVVALRLVYREGRPTVLPVKSASSNDRGEYRMYWLEPGDYLVRAEKVLPTGPARAYYPGTARTAASVKVRVSEGAESPKIDFSIQKDESFRISGIVTNIVAGPQNPPVIAPAPAPVAVQPLDREALRARLQFEAAQTGPLPQFYLSPIDSDEIYEGFWLGLNALTSAPDRAAGRFEIPNVRPGSYDLISVVTDRSSTPPRYFTGRALVEVGVQDVSDVSLLIAPGRDLRGRIVYPGNVSPAAPVRVQLRPKGLLPVLPLAPGLSAVAEADGTFRIANVPDLQYSVSAGPLPKDAYVADLRQGGFSIFDVGTIVPGKRGNDEFEVIVDSPGATINGNVTELTAPLAAGAVVALVPDERRRGNLLLYKRTNASETGVFSFTGIAPGRYTLFAWESIPAGAEFNAEFMDRFRDEGKEIAVDPGDTTAVELRLIPG